MKALVLSLLLLASNLYGLDSDAIRKIASEAHSRENLIEELKLYPNAREYKVTDRSGPPGGKFDLGPEIVVTEKTVRGRYIVSEAKIPGVENPIIMVVTFDKKTDTFRKWVLLPNGSVGAATGVADLKTRTIAWISNEAHGEPPTTVLSIESHSDAKSTWKETAMQDGKVIRITQGTAVKTK